jgi:Zn-dependent metalloprotease
MRFSLLIAFSFLFSFNFSFGMGASPQGGTNSIRSDQTVTLYHESDKGIPDFVEGRFAQQVARGSEAAATIDFFTTHRDAYKMIDPAGELQAKRLDVDRLGMRHQRMIQLYNGIKVIGGELISHFTKDGVLKAVNGTYYPDIKVSTTPQITAAAAQKIAGNDLESFFGKGDPRDEELVIFPWGKTNHLAWRMFFYSETPMGRWEYFVDALSGEVIFKANRIMNAEAIGTGTGVMGNTYNHIDTYDNGSTYEMTDYTRQLNNNIHGHNGQMPSGHYIKTYIASSSLPGTLATDADNTWTATSEAPAVDGQIYTAAVYDWWLDVFGRNGYDDNGASMTTSVNYSAEGDNNAYWNGSEIVIWSWSSGWRSLAGCPDVIAHEWGHAITERTSGLVYQKESGALNESFSDMMGAAFEWAHDTLDTPDWLMGENGRTSGVAFRDMSDPHAFGDPDYYGTSDPYWYDVVGCSPSQFNDYCGVHTNSGVGNKWFYLLSDGGTFHGVTVTGLTVANAIQVAYRANAYYWTSNSDYHDAAVGTISAAHDLDPSGNWEIQVAQAWNAVGVSTPSPSLAFTYPSGVPETTMPGQATNFEVDVTGVLGGVPVSGSGQIVYSVNGRAFEAHDMTELTTDHYQATLPSMSCGDVVEFYVRATMDPGIVFNDPSPSTPYSAVPATAVATVFEDDFETDLGWTISGGSWARGVPTGGGGSHGNPDPTSGYVGPNEMGYNLSGDYTDNMPERHVTSPAIDCSGMSKVHLKFWRYLGVEQPLYDHAYVRVSADGSSWTTIWQNDVEITDNAWSEQDLDISSVADDQPTVYIRFTMGTSDGGWTYCGWNIDDVRVTGNECANTALTITTTSLPSWTAGVAFSQQLTAINGTGTLVWSDINGDLAGTGMSLSSSGMLSGTPSSSGTIGFVAEVIDDASDTALQSLSLTVNPSLQVTTASLHDWTAGYAFASQLTSSGGTGTKTWTDKNGDLSGTGLAMASNGLISGTPSSAGPISFTAMVTDNVGGSAEHTFGITINPALTISTSSLPDWTAGLAYSQQIDGSGGTGTAVWSDKNNSLAGTGLSLSATGLLSGTPTSAASVSFIAKLTDSIGASTEQTFGFTVNAAPAITTASLPDWTQGAAYSQQLAATGGTGSLAWTDQNGDLSGTGLTLNATGLVSGTPTTSGPISFTAQASDDLSVSTTHVYSFTVNPAVAISTTTMPDMLPTVPYSSQLDASGGTGALTWTDKNNELAAAGLSLSSTGEVSGTPTASSAVSFTAVATDQIGASAEQPLTIGLSSIVEVTTTSLPDWTVGVSYSEQLEAVGGIGTKTWTDKNGDLAGTGLSLSSSGLLSGTPASAGTISFTAEVVDSVGTSAEQPLSVLVNAALQITTDSMPTWTMGVAYSDQLTATGGTGTATWSDMNGDLAGTGLSISSDGIVSGTPTSSGTVSFTAQVTDAIGGVGIKPMSMTVNPAVLLQIAALSDGLVGTAYSAQISATGGTGTLTYTDLNGDLSGTGLALSPDGQLTGTPTIDGSLGFTVHAEDAVGGYDEQTYNVMIAAYVCGDVNGDGTVDVADIIYLADYMFGDPAGPAPAIVEAADVDGSGTFDISDLIYLVDYSFGEPAGPDPVCGGGPIAK